MPKVSYTAAKGLFQETGNGVNFNVLGSKLGVVANTTTSAPTQLANGYSGALTANTIYLAPADGAAFTATLPSNASSKAGDVIVVLWNVAGTAGTAKFGTSTQMFAVGSTVYKGGGVEVDAVDVSDATDDFLNIAYQANAGPGIGSKITFQFNGTAWRAEARIAKLGSGAVAHSNAVFATS